MGACVKPTVAGALRLLSEGDAGVSCEVCLRPHLSNSALDS